MNRRNFLSKALAGVCGLAAGALGLLSRKKQEPEYLVDEKYQANWDDAVGDGHEVGIVVCKPDPCHVLTEEDMNILTLGGAHGLIPLHTAIVNLKWPKYNLSNWKNFGLWSKIKIKVQGHVVFVGYIKEFDCKLDAQRPIMILKCVDARAILKMHPVEGYVEWSPNVGKPTLYPGWTKEDQQAFTDHIQIASDDPPSKYPDVFRHSPMGPQEGQSWEDYWNKEIDHG